MNEMKNHGTRKMIIRVDIDTRRGFCKGLPQLLDLFHSVGIKSSLCVPMGRDESGRAFFTLLKDPQYMARVIRLGGIKRYGLKTALNGLLIPAPQIVKDHELRLLLECMNRGFEIIPHGYNHRFWQDKIFSNCKPWSSHAGEKQILDDIAKATTRYKDCFGRNPEGFAAPAWRITPQAFFYLEELGFKYSSSVRGGNVPFYPQVRGKRVNILEIPVNLAPLDETLARPDISNHDILDLYVKRIDKINGVVVYTAHAEIEGNSEISFFSKFLGILLKRNFEFTTFEECASMEWASVNTLELRRIKGRGGFVTCQRDVGREILEL